MTRRRILLLGLALASLGVGIAGWWWHLRPKPVATVKPTERVYGSPPGYVGSQACVSCHRKISESFQRSEMARSWSLVADAPPIEQDGEVHDAKSDLHYKIERHDERLFVREVRLDEEGQEIHSLEVEATYAVGSGLHGRSYVRQQQGYLANLPVAWYSDAGHWALSPGYEETNIRFSRTVPPQCVGCHNAEPTFIAGSGNRYRLPLPRGIGCESCHGPGGEHVEQQRRAMTGGELPDDAHRAIVNPARLLPDLQQDVCLQCHLLGETIVTQPGKDIFDFRPGQRLRDFRNDFFISDQTGERPGSVGHPSRSMNSRCFTESGGRMTCSTCHNPHVPLQEVPPGYYNEQCLTCHQDRGCNRPLEPGQSARDGDCVACHMPHGPSGNIGHAVTTEHRIRRRPATDEPQALARPEQPSPASLPQGFWGDEDAGQIGSAVILGIENWNNPELLNRGVELLERALRQKPDIIEWQYRLALGYFQTKRWGSCAATLEKVLRKAPDMIEAQSLLSKVYVRLEQPDRALKVVEDMLRRYPDFAGADTDLAILCFDIHQPDRLLTWLNGPLQNHPPNQMVLTLAAKAELMREGGSEEEALRMVEQAEALDPLVPYPFIFEVQIAMNQNDMKRAERALRAVIRLQKETLPAYQALGELLVRSGRRDEAIKTYKQALEIDPLNPTMQRNLQQLERPAEKQQK